MLLLDDDDQIIEANAKASKLLLTDNLIGKKLQDLLSPEHYKSLKSNPEGTLQITDGNELRLTVEYGFTPATDSAPGSFAFTPTTKWSGENNAYQLQSYLTNSPLGVIELDRNKTILNWSKRAEQIFEWTGKEVIGRNLDDLNMIHPDDEDIVHLVVDELMGGNVEGNTCYNRNITRNERTVSCVWYNSILKDENGQMLSILCLVQDVTELERIEQLWLESKREITPFFSNTLSGFFFMELEEPLKWDANLNPEAAIDHIFEHARITRTNRAMLDQYKAEESDIIGRSPVDFFPNNLEQAKKTFLEFVKTGRIRTETEETRLDGSTFWVEGDYTAIYNDDEHLVGLFGIQHDITKRKTAQKELQNSESKFRTLFEQATDGILIIDEAGRIIDANTSMCKLCSMPLNTLIQTPLKSLLSPIAKELKANWLDKDLSVADFELFTSSNTLAVEISTRKQPDGTLQAIVRNVTERRLAERRLKENEQLLKKVSQLAKVSSWKLTTNNQVIIGDPTCLGIEASQLSLDTWVEMFDKPSAKSITSAIKESLTTGEPFDIEAELDNKTRGIQCVRIIGTSIGDDDAPHQLIGAIQDITEQKAYNRKLEHEKSLSDAIINSMPGVFYFFTEEGKYIRWNKILEDISGYSGEEIADGHPLMFFGEDEQPLLIEKITSVFTNGSDKVEAHLRLKDGTRIPYFFTGSRFIYEGKPCLLGLGQDITEQKRTQDQIIRTNEQLKAAQSIANVGYWELDVPTDEMFWSEEMYDIFGADPNKGPLPFGQFLTKVHEEDREGVMDFMNSINSDEFIQFEYRFEHSQLGQRVIRVKAIGIIDNTGELGKIEGAVQDITETKEREEELFQINQRYELISKATNDAIWDWDISNNNTIGNDRLYELYGVPPGTIISDEMFYDHIHADDLGRVKSSLTKVLKNRKHHITQEYRFLHADGTYRDIMDKVYIIYGNDGLPKRMLGAMQDITTQKESERQLQAASNRLLLAATSASLGIFDWNLSSGRMVWNEYMYSIFSVDPDEFQFTFDDWLHCLHPRDVVAFNEKIETSIERGRPFHDRFRIVWPNNEIRHVEAHALVSRNNKKEATAMVGVCRDITDSVNAEQDIAKAIIQTQEEERFETGRELHDHIIQLLVAARMNLNHVIDKLDEFPSVQRSFELTGTAIEDIRKLSHRLAPASLEDTALDEAMSSLLEGFNTHGQFTINFESEMNTEVPIPDNLKLNLYRILQEQLNNIVKHANARTLTLQLTINDFKIYMLIADDGQGLNKKNSAKGIGLNNIRRRVEIFNGNLQVVSAPNDGFKIIVEIPREADN
ncbi:PAS domain S-box-containing protein [Marinoscillum furvescens DSM 4134]|uniref:histidine kinase n=2 Tax=Marinoscillum furvescens TaxID=1026 RepID=A0A3D9L251_MARFU|nr:PAS domain S-box-containing protein [Marinoscillum furvescens DSM 4134]